MQSTNIPSKIPLPFGYAAGSSYINPIPAASQIGINDGRASLHDGFPPDTFTPVAAGGIPPFGGDFNGILNEITSITQWQEAGGFFVYDATFSTAVGGYPKGAILQSTSFDGLWTSSVENNTSNPDANGAGWTPTAFNNLKSIALSGSSVTLTQVQAAYPILIFTGTLTANCTVNIPAQVGKWIVVNRTTGSFTVQFKTPSGTGVYAPQGYAVYTYGDATNIYYVSSGFSTQEGYLTATQGQTLFPLTGFNYVPNTNNIAIFVNGSKQLSGVNFSETSSTAISFLSGLNAGDIVEFVIGASFGSPSIWASNVYYNEQGTGAVTRTLESKLQETISVLDFGAVGDGVADDTDALQNAINAAENNKLYIPAGTYIIQTLSLLVPSNITIYGNGIGRTILKAGNSASVPTSGAIFNNSNIPSNVLTVNSTTLNTNITISDMTLDGNKANNVGGYLYALYFVGVSNITLTNVRAQNTTGQGLQLNFTDKVQILNCESDSTNADGIQLADSMEYLIDGCKVTNSGDYGIEVDHGLFPVTSTYSTGSGTISNNVVSGCVNFGIAVRGQINTENPNNNPIKGAVIIGNHVTTSSSGICLQEAVDSCVVEANESYANSGSGIVCSPGTIAGITQNTTIKNNISRDNANMGIFADSAVQMVIEGNIIVRNQYYGIKGSFGYSLIKGNNVSGNCLSSSFSFSGIAVQDCTNATIEGNFIYNEASTCAYAIAELTSNCANNSFINNYHGSKGFGFQSTQRFFSDPQTVSVGPTGAIVPTITSTVPTTSSAGGTVGNMAISGTYLYINNGGQWYRVPVSTF